MFDFDVSKVFILGVVALIAIPPKDLPRAMRQLGQMIGRMRRMAAEFQGHFNEAMRDADIEGLKTQVNSQVNSIAQSAQQYNPIDHVRSEVTQAVSSQQLSQPSVQLSLPPLPEPVLVTSANFLTATQSQEQPRLKKARKVRGSVDIPQDSADIDMVSKATLPKAASKAKVAKPKKTNAQASSSALKTRATKKITKGTVVSS
jgi:sec-independent protein translocase protein TatB